MLLIRRDTRHARHYSQEDLCITGKEEDTEDFGTSHILVSSFLVFGKKTDV